MSESRPVPPSEPDSESPPSPFYLVVRLDQHSLALPVAQVVEVCRVPPLQPARGEAPGLLGFASLRGTPTPVFDLNCLLGLAGELDGAARLNPSSHVRLVSLRMAPGSSSTRAASAAFVVDEVIGLREIPSTAIRSIALPGDRTRRLGEFDQQFARLIDASGLIPSHGLPPAAGEPPVQPTAEPVQPSAEAAQ